MDVENRAQGSSWLRADRGVLGGAFSIGDGRAVTCYGSASAIWDWACYMVYVCVMWSMGLLCRFVAGVFGKDGIGSI
jgi:hypothetical protein